MLENILPLPGSDLSKSLVRQFKKHPYRNSETGTAMIETDSPLFQFAGTCEIVYGAKAFMGVALALDFLAKCNGESVARLLDYLKNTNDLCLQQVKQLECRKEKFADLTVTQLTMQGADWVSSLFNQLSTQFGTSVYFGALAVFELFRTAEVAEVVERRQ